MKNKKTLGMIAACAVIATSVPASSIETFAEGKEVENDIIVSEEQARAAVKYGIVSGHVQDEEGNPLITKVNIRKKNFGLLDILYTTTTYTDSSGNFTLKIKPGTYIVTVDKGSEYEQHTQEINVYDQGFVNVEASLDRIIDLTSMGWYAGDQHQHSSEDTEEGKSTPRDMVHANIALGCTWGNLADHSNRDEDDSQGYYQSYYTKWKDTANLDTNVGAGFLPIVGSEVSATTNGHYNRIGGSHERIAQFAADENGVMRIGNDIKALGGVSVINHPNNAFDGNIDFEYWDNEEVVNTFDAVEIWNNSFPIGIDGFLNNESIQSWYEHLSKGNKLSAVAGTDCHDMFVDSIPHITEEELLNNEEVIAAYEDAQANGSRISIGDLISKLKSWLNYGFANSTVRTYVQTDEFSEDGILDSIRRGSTFVTNGPVVLAEVDGKIPGYSVKGNESNKLEVKLTSNRPLTEAVIVVDGQIHETIALDNVTDTTITRDMDLSDATWVAVYAKGNHPEFAHTGAIYVRDVIKDNLQTEIYSINTLDTSIYTKDSVEALEAALNNANIVYENKEATQVEVDSATEALRNAIDNLDEIVENKDVLEEKVTQAKTIVKDNYTELSFKKLQESITTGEAVLAKETVSKKEIDKAIENIQIAIDSLVVKVEFTDINNHWAKDAIKRFASIGYINGYEDGTFKPDNSVTRAEFVKVVNSVFEFTDVSEVEFTDVDTNGWYYEEVAKGVKAGYINGYEDKTFRPDNNITREEAAKIIATIMNLEGDGVLEFKDASKVSDWAKNYVDALSDANIINGYEDNTFRPSNKITRAESVTILNRTIK